MTESNLGLDKIQTWGGNGVYNKNRGDSAAWSMVSGTVKHVFSMCIEIDDTESLTLWIGIFNEP